MSTFQLQLSNETTNWAVLTRQYNKRQHVSLRANAYKGVAVTGAWELRSVLCDVKSGVGEEDRHTTRPHWSGISVTEEEQAGVQAGSQKRHDDRSQTSILSHRLETGHQQQQGAAMARTTYQQQLQRLVYSVECLADWGEHYMHRQDRGLRWCAECCRILQLWKVTKTHLINAVICRFYFQQWNFTPKGTLIWNLRT